MKGLRRTLVDVAKALTAYGIDYMVIGGMSHIAWGSARTTSDIDLTVAVERDEHGRLLEALRHHIEKLPPDLDEYLADGLLPFNHRSGVRVDLLLSKHPYAQHAMERAVPITILGTPVKFCTPEDLVLHKIISERERDRSDVADLLRRRRDTLDREYLDPRVHELAVILERPEIEERYRSLLC